VEPIIPRLRNNKDVHLDYLRHLKKSVETIRDIVEEAKFVRPRDRSIVSACRYTKHSQELLEHAIGTCPQGSQQRAKQLAYIPLIMKNQVTVAIPSDKSDRVNSCPNASGSQPKSHVKLNRISPAKGVNKLPVEDQPKTNKSHLRTSNRADSSSHLKRTESSSPKRWLFLTTDKMADLNAPSGQTPAMAPPLRADDQILPHIRWVSIGKSNCYLDLKKSQSNPIYMIAVDLLKNTNFFRAFTASSIIPSIYIQQFWDTILYDKKAGCYRCQLDEQWFVLTKETLREALHITLVNNDQALAAPPSIDGLIDFVNQLGYPKLVRNLSNTKGNIDYAERIWEEFTQSIHTFIEDKRNLSRHTSGKKRATLIVIPSIQFTKLIIHHLQRRHGFHPRPDSPLHLANEEPVLGYLKFSAKGTKREVFEMPIPGSLITAKIQQASYYREYLAKVAQHRRYLASETGGVQDPPAPKPTQPARNPKTTAPKAPSSKKHSRKNVEASKNEEVPTVEPQVTDKDSEYQKVLEESMQDPYALPRGTLPPVVIREPGSVKYQPLPYFPGKGKAKVTEEQVAHDLLSLQKHKKTSPAEQYIFQRRVSEPTGSSGHDESPYALIVQSDSEEESEKVVLEAEEGGQDEDAGAQAEGQAGSNPDETSEGQVGSNPDKSFEGQAGLDPGDAEAKVQSVTSHVVRAGSNREHMDLDVANVSPLPSTEQLDEGFTAIAYPKVQENLKLAIEEQVLLEKPASSSRTISSLQHLSRDFSFGDQFFNDKPSEDDKNAKTKVESMVNVPIQFVLSSISLQTSPIIDLFSRPESPKAHQQFKATTTDTKTTTTTLPPPQAPQQSTTEAMMVKRIDAVDWAMQAPLRNRFRDLPEADMKEILHQRMWESESYKSHEDHMQLFKALEKSMNRDHSEELVQELAEARKKKKKSRESPKTPPGSPSHQPPPPPLPAGHSRASGAPGASGSAQVPTSAPPSSSTNQESPSKGSAAPSPSKTAASAEYQAWTTTDIRLRSSISLTPTDLEMDEDMAPAEQAQSSDDKDIESAYIPTVNLRQGWWKPFEEERPVTPEPAWSIRSSDLPVLTNNWASALASNYSPPPEDSLLAQTGDIATFIDWFCKRRGITELKPQDLEGPAYEIIKIFHPDVIHLQYQMEECHKLLTDSVNDPILRHNVSKPLPLGGPPGQVIIQSDFFFNKDLEYLRYGSKGRRPALSISKMKVAYYPDAGLEQMVPNLFWIEEECKYDIAAMYAQSGHMRILSVVQIEVFSMYGYDYMKKIVLRRADLNEYVIAERDFKQLVIRQRVEDFQLGIESYQTQPNLTKPQWDATGYEYKHDYTVIDSPRAAIFWDKYGVQMMMRVNEIHKKDVDRSKAFMFAIQRRLKIRRIFRSLESFVDGRVRDGDYRLLKRTE
nr:integrase, catalytic region, zinc finger, CCHC-type, peptidase aspartic, catalytic [Tanacetum cinerariifolium]